MVTFTHHDIHSQSKKVIYRVYVFLKKLSTMENLSAEFFKKTQKLTAEMCGISERSIQNIVAEVKKYENDDTPTPRSLFASPKKSYKRKKVMTDIDDFNVDVVRLSEELFMNFMTKVIGLI